MRDGVLTSVLLGASLGLSVGLRRTVMIETCVLALAACVATAIGLRGTVTDDIQIQAWIVIAATAATSWLPRRSAGATFVVLGCVSGALAGVLPTASRAWQIAAFAIGLISTAGGSTILSARGWILPTRVAASWLVAIAALNVTLTLLPVTPGYLPDHLE